MRDLLRVVGAVEVIETGNIVSESKKREENACDGSVIKLSGRRVIGWRRRTLLGRVETSFSRNESESAASENKSSGIVMPRDASDKFPTDCWKGSRVVANEATIFLLIRN